MLEVIHSRKLPLDRITTTDVWATETISANLPPVEGKVFMVNGNGVIIVEYLVNGVALRISFLPSDIGRNLKILK